MNNYRAIHADHVVERSFLILLICSLVLHICGGFILYRLSAIAPEPPKDPVFIDLQQIPAPNVAPKAPQKTERFADRQIRVPRETAPRGIDTRDSGKPAPASPQAQAGQPRSSNGKTTPIPLPRTENQIAPGSAVSSLLKKKNPAPTVSAQQLMPSASRMAKLEETYRRRFEQDIAEGDTKFLNSDDIQFGSFLRRFENSVYGVWRYPQEAAMKGIEGIVPVRITFNRKGEISNIQQLESSGTRILDDEVIRTLRAIGPVGSFPKGYDKDEFHLIAFFQYGGARRSLR